MRHGKDDRFAIDGLIFPLVDFQGHEPRSYGIGRVDRHPNVRKTQRIKPSSHLKG